MMNQSPEAIAFEFINRINAGDPDGMAELLTLDHESIDMSGSASRGRETMRKGWIDYFRMFPDYKIRIEDTHAKSHKVIFIGTSEGTLSEDGRAIMIKQNGAVPPDNELQGPAIWSAIVCDGKIAQWRIYDDNAETRHALGLAADASKPLQVQAIRR